MKNVQQVFVGTLIDNTAGVAVGALPAGSFSVLQGSDVNSVPNAGASAGGFYHWGLGTATDSVVSDSFPVLGSSRSVTVSEYQAAVDKGISIDIGKVSCETEYMLKIRFEGEAIAKTYGYNDLIKTFSYTTECCDPCSTACPSGSCLDLMWGLAVNVNADPEMLVAALINSAAFAAAALIPSGGAQIITQADVDAYIVYVTAPATLKTYDEICADLSFGLAGQTSDPSALVCGQDPMSLTQTVVDFHVGLLGGFECNGSSQTVQQAIAYAFGEPYQVANVARWAEGYKRKFGVYRTPFPYDTFASNGPIDPATTYDVATILISTLDQGAATLNPTFNEHEIIVAVPAGGPGVTLVAMQALIA